MGKLESVLAGVDFSDSSAAAIREAGRLAARHGARFNIVHAVTPHFVEEYRQSVPDSQVDVIDTIRTQVEQFCRASLGDDPIPIEASVFIGRPFTELLRAAEEVSADLLVLGSHGLTVGSHDVGNLASRCVRKAPLPVLLVRDSHRGAFETVVAAVDFSETSALALTEAALIAERDGASLRVLHVHCPPWLWANHYAYDLKVAPKRDYETEYHAILSDQMKAFIAPVEQRCPGLPISSDIIESDATQDAIENYLKREGADVVVIGTRGRSGIKSLLLGTTAERLLRNSPCSVLTVKPHGFEMKP